MMFNQKLIENYIDVIDVLINIIDIKLFLAIVFILVIFLNCTIF
jgi:hypothetical protein